MNDLAERLQDLAAKAASGALSDQDRLELAELGKVEGAKVAPQRLAALAAEAAKGELSAQARHELQQLGATLAEGRIARYQFDALSPASKAELIKSGTRVIDAPAPRETRTLAANEISRAAFEAMSAVERSEYLRRGGRPVDLPE